MPGRFLKDSDEPMKDFVVLLTGALSGIGRAAATAFAYRSANIVVSGRRADAGEALARDLRSLGAAVEFIACDVRHEVEVMQLVDKTIQRFGRMDAAVNSAGAIGARSPITDQTPESYTDLFNTNVLGVLLCMKHELRVMQSQGTGAIVNISSTLGIRGTANSSLYTSSKHAVEGLTKVAAIEAGGFGVRVNAVAPGTIETEMFTQFAGGSEIKARAVSGLPLKRAGTTEEAAAAILFLASPNASYITGQILGVDGGRMAS